MIRKIMIPLRKYSIVPPEASLRDVVLNLKNAYCDSKGKFCDKAGARLIFVVDETGRLLGMLDLQTVLKALIPEITGSFGEKLRFQAISIAFAEADSLSQDETQLGLKARINKNANLPVGDIMQPIPAALHVDSSLLEAAELFYRYNISAVPVYDENTLVGIVRDRDLFITVTDIID